MNVALVLGQSAILHPKFDRALGIGDLGCPLLGVRRVLREQFDLNRLALALQVANHVLQKLHELDFDGWLLHIDLGTDVFDYVVNVAPSVLLQFDQNVASIGLGHCSRPKFRARAP